MDTVRDVLPFGANERVTVAKRFINAGGAADRYRDQDSLNKNLDKQNNMTKSTENFSCLPKVRTAKIIARDIVGTANAGIVRDTSKKDAQNIGANDGRNSGEQNIVGVFKQKRVEA